MTFKSASDFKNFLQNTYPAIVAVTAQSVFSKLQPVASSDNKLANAIVFKLNKNVIEDEELELAVLEII